MKAAVYRRYGSPDVLEVTDVPTPVPKAREVRIKVHATTVNAADWRLRSLEVPRGFGPILRLMVGVRRPRQPILGLDLAGKIESVGPAVTSWKAGDEVVAFSGFALGCHAEYKVMREDRLVARKPKNLDWGEAASLFFGGLTALDFLRKAKIRKGDRVLVNGASGAVGVAALQLGRHYGADVTAVCSTANVELVKSLGAGTVIDYTREDFTKNGQRYDVIMDNAGTAPWPRSKGSLKDGGKLLLVLAGLPQILKAPWQSLTSGKKVIAGGAGERIEDMRFLIELAESGELKPVIDRRFPLAQIADAHRLVDSGRKKGSVVVTLVD